MRPSSPAAPLQPPSSRLRSLKTSSCYPRRQQRRLLMPLGRLEYSCSHSTSAHRQHSNCQSHVSRCRRHHDHWSGCGVEPRITCPYG